MQSSLAKVFFLTICLLGMSTQAHAWGLGVNITGSDGELDEDGVREDVDIETREIGVTFDSDNGGWFNVRGHLNRVEGEIGTADFDGWGLHGAFGLRIFQNAAIRIWGGPSADIQILELDNRFEEDLSSFGIGPVIGIDLRAGPVVRFSIETGVKLRFVEFESDFEEDEADLEGGEGFLRLSVLFGPHGGSRKMPQVPAPEGHI